MMTPAILAGWAVVTLTDGRVIAGMVEPLSNHSLQVLVGTPCRSVTFMGARAVRSVRACSQADALTAQGDHPGAHS